MLTQLATVKARLSILDSDTQFDDLLTRAIETVSARFDRECNRSLARTVDVRQEFRAGEIEVPVSCYPVEAVTRFEVKSSEAGGWVVATGVDYLVRGGCVISLAVPLRPLLFPGALARMTYTGGYVLPGTVPEAGQSALPADIETAAVEQVAFWYQTRDSVGVKTFWPKGGNYLDYADTDLLPSVRAVLRRHTRFWL